MSLLQESDEFQCLITIFDRCHKFKLGRLALAISLVSGGQVLAQSFPSQLALSSLDGNTGFTIDGESTEDFSGSAISAAGDINGDGVDGLLVGAYGADPNGERSGSAYVVFGRGGLVSEPFPENLSLSALNGSNGFKLNGTAAFDIVGASLSQAGDVNGDGFDDILIGAYGDSTEDDLAGAAYVLFGQDGSIPGAFPSVLPVSNLDGSNGFKFIGSDQFDFFGQSVSPAGDLNFDGIDDLIIGASGASFFSTDGGIAYAIYGRDYSIDTPFPPVSSSFFADAFFGVDDFNGTNPIDVGKTVSFAGDVNGDGIDDVLIADPEYPLIGPNFRSGRSYVVFGRASVQRGDPLNDLDALDGTDGFKIDGENSYDRLGWSLSSASDVNGDGIDDFILGTYLSPSSGVGGTAYVIFGRDVSAEGAFPEFLNLSELDGSDGFKIVGGTSNDLLGRSVSGAGDINGDGVSDILVGAPRGSIGGSNTESGVAYVIFGKDEDQGAFFPAKYDVSTLDGSNGFRIDGEAIGDLAGRAVSAAGDVNNDGVDDLLVGASRMPSNGNAAAGRTYIIFGGNDGPGSGRIEVAADPSTVNLGGVAINTSTSSTVSLVNQSTTEPTIGNLIIEGNPDFSILNDNCSGQTLGTTVGLDDFCTFELAFSSSDVGVFNATLTAPYNSVLGPETIELSAFSGGVFIDGFEN